MFLDEDGNIDYHTIISLTFLIGLFIVLRIIISGNPILDYQDVCQYEHGKNWTYEYSSLYGRTCVEIDFITSNKINRTLLNLTDEEMLKKYCDLPNFWDFSRWSPKCI